MSVYSEHAGVTLWGNEALTKNLTSKCQENTTFEIVASDSLSDKLSAMDISASLKGSFLAGLINVNGSATYLNDTKISKHQARVTLKYSRTTKFEQLSMDHLGIRNVTYHDVFDKGTATHVVTGILYGANAFFVFDHEASHTESTEDIEGNLQAVIKKSVSVEGEAALKLEAKEKEHVDKFNCKFYGDFAIERNPVSYEDAMRIYSSLPSLLGENGWKAAPVRVWLYPLRKLNSKAAELVQEISENLVVRAEGILQYMLEVDMQCHDLMKELSAQKFPPIKKKISEFRNQCQQFRTTFQKQLLNILPLIRSGQSAEEALADILTMIDQSPFAERYIEEHLQRQHYEIKVLNECLKDMSEIDVLPSAEELQVQVRFSNRNQYVVCCNFNSLHEEDPYLTDLKHRLQINPVLSAGGVYENKKVSQWFQDEDISMIAMDYLRTFQELAQVNRASGKTKFLISSVLDKNHPGVSIYLYEGGSLLSKTFEPPVKPGLPRIVSKSHDSIELNLNPADFGKKFIEGYIIAYRQPGEESWSSYETEDKDLKVTIKRLKPNTKYQFQYCVVSKAGVSVVSDVTKEERTLPTSPPERIQGMPGPTSIILNWKEPSIRGVGVTVTEYKIEWKQDSQFGSHVWSESRTGKKVEKLIIENLIINTSYTIRVSAICGDHGVSAPSSEINISTLEHRSLDIKEILLKSSRLLTRNNPSVYQLKKKSCNEGYRKYILGKEKTGMETKVILLVGATGSGKTTLINGMANYILGVNWEDDFRFKLVHEVTNRSQAHSQTSEVTAYVIHHETGHRIPYSLTLIDTPGFGDTRGIEQDKKLTQDIEAFFKSDKAIDRIDAVCFVVQSSLGRLTHTQKYVFNSVFSIFGKDIKDNIMVLINFCDGGKPPVLEAIQSAEIGCPNDQHGDPAHYKFNNSALFANNQTSSIGFDKMFWDMGATSLGTFFSALSKMETKSLKLTKEVLQERKQLENNVQALQRQINAGLTKLEELRKTQSVLQQNKVLMEANKDFQIEVEITVPEKEDTKGNFITNCQQCHFTCHDDCAYGNDQDKIKCCCMSDGYCTVCPGKCVWSVHFNQKYKWKYVTKKEKKTYGKLKAKYEKAAGEALSAESILQKVKEEYYEVREAIRELIDYSSKSLKRLREIALKPNPLTTPEYIDLMIQSEEQEAQPGFLNRIKSLGEVRKRAEIMEKIEKGEELLPEEVESQSLYATAIQYAKRKGKALKNTVLSFVSNKK
uniref:Fibronectin type-III domain-containing protein n=1 Tax=Xenopus tropicalis TaxID=8364 RepID=A0A1B8Y0R3_XENTR